MPTYDSQRKIKAGWKGNVPSFACDLMGGGGVHMSKVVLSNNLSAVYVS